MLPMDKLKIFLADDHHVVRAGLKALINNQPDMVVIGEAGDGRSTLEQAQQIGPDVVVMDVSMPIMGGVEATRLLKTHQPPIKILALTIHEEEGFLEQLINAGAFGLRTKTHSRQRPYSSIRPVDKGGHTWTPPLRAWCWEAWPRLRPPRRHVNTN